MRKERGRTRGLAIVWVAVSVAGATPVVGQEPLRVLFVGNSYTYYNNLPQVVAEMASEVPGAAPIVTGRVTFGGATLAGLWREGSAVDSIRTGRWDMVVLQEQSLLGGFRIDGEPVLGEPDSLLTYARLFRDEVEGQGAETVLLLTWAREGAPEQQAGLDHAYVSVARELDLRLVPVGRVWARVREALPDAGLYSPDGSHPSPRGTWVAAATTVATILEAHAVETLPGSIRTDSLDGGGEAVPGRTSRLEVPGAFVRVVGQAVREELADLRAAGGYPVTDPPERRPLPAVPRAMSPGPGELAGAWSGALTMQVPGTLRLIVRSVEDDGPAGDVLVTLGSSEFESSLGGARMVDGVLSGEVGIGMGGVVRYRLAYRGDALVGVAELLMGRLVAVSSVRLEREGGTAVVASPVVVQEPVANGHPVWGADGRIYFHSDRDGEADIYVMGVDGGDQRRFTTSGGAARSIAWSPDGSVAALMVRRGGDYDLSRTGRRGGEVDPLVVRPGEDWDPVWSPDGSRIVWMATTEGGDHDLYLFELEGEEVRRVTERPGMEAYPDWTPDGRWLVFLLRDGDNDIYEMRPDGSEARNLTDHPAEDNGPRVSPDGRRIVFFSNRDGNFEIYVMNRDGTEPTRLTRDEGGDVYPTWSPDGAWIAFESDRTGTPEIYRMRPDGSELRILTGPGAAEHADRGDPRR